MGAMWEVVLGVGVDNLQSGYDRGGMLVMMGSIMNKSV